MTEASERSKQEVAILALAQIRKGSYKTFMKFALEIMDNQQVDILLQEMVRWINENPPDKKSGGD